MNSINLKSSTYINFNKSNNKKYPKFKVRDNVRISKYKNIFAKDLKKFLWLKKLKTLFHGHMLLVILTVKKLFDHFTKRNCKNTNKKGL